MKIWKALSLVAITALFTVSCEEIDQLTTFDLDYNSSVTVPGTLGLDIPLDINTPSIPTNIDSELSANSTGANLIEHIILKDIDLVLNSPSNGDLSFLKSVELYIEAENLQEQLIASSNDIPEDVGTILSLTASGVNLKDYLTKDSFSIRAAVTTDKVITTDHEININKVFEIKASLLGN